MRWRSKKSSSQDIRVVVVHRARINATELSRVTLIAVVLTARRCGVVVVHRARINAAELFRVTLIAVVLTANGFGTLGVVARDINIVTNQSDAYYAKPKLWRNEVSLYSKPDAKLQHWRVSGIFFVYSNISKIVLYSSVHTISF